MLANSQPNLRLLQGRPLPSAIASFVETAAALFDVDRGASHRFLSRAVALMRAGRYPEAGGVCARAPTRGAMAAWQLRRVMAYIDANLGMPIHASELAHQANLSAGQFFRAFKVTVGVPPFRYILEKRIELARRMITTTDAPLSHIAAACGLYDQAHLCRVFRRLVGESPSSWRRRNAPAYSRNALARP